MVGQGLNLDYGDLPTVTPFTNKCKRVWATTNNRHTYMSRAEKPENNFSGEHKCGILDMGKLALWPRINVNAVLYEVG